MKLIPLIGGGSTLVDDADYAALAASQWKASLFDNRNTYVVRVRPPSSVPILMHREIMLLLPGQRVRHRDKDGLNNQRSNLQTCTRQEIARTRKRGLNNKAGFKGVYWEKGKWRTNIWVNRRKITVGYFSGRVEAARAYDEMAAMLFGEFACLNFPLAGSVGASVSDKYTQTQKDWGVPSP